MLGKLIKNSFKAHMSRVYPIYIAMLIIGALMMILMLFDWSNGGESSIGLGLLIKGIAAGLLCVTAFVGLIVTLVAVIGDFSRSMYGREGRLTLTLPVKSSSLLFAKWFSGSFWVLLSYLALCAAVFGSALYLLNHSLELIESDESYFSVYELAVSMLEGLFASFGFALPSVAVVFNMLSLVAIAGGIRICFFVMLVFFAITLAHCRPFSKAGKVGGLLYYLAGFAAIHGFAFLVRNLVEIYLLIGDDAYTFTLSAHNAARAITLGLGAFPITELYCITMSGIILYLVTTFLIDRKVNVD